MIHKRMRVTYGAGRLFLWEDRLTPIVVWAVIATVSVAVIWGALGKLGVRAEDETFDRFEVVMSVIAVLIGVGYLIGLFVAPRRAGVIKADVEHVELADGTRHRVRDVSGVLISNAGGERKLGLVMRRPKEHVVWLTFSAPWLLEHGYRLAHFLPVPVYHDETLSSGVKDEIADHEVRMVDFVNWSSNHLLDGKVPSVLAAEPIIEEKGDSVFRVRVEDPEAYIRSVKRQTNVLLAIVLAVGAAMLGLGIYQRLWPIVGVTVPATMIAITAFFISRRMYLKPVEKATWFLEKNGDGIVFPDGTAVQRDVVRGVCVSWNTASIHAIELALVLTADAKSRFQFVMRSSDIPNREKVFKLAYDLAGKLGVPVYFVRV